MTVLYCWYGGVQKDPVAVLYLLHEASMNSTVVQFHGTIHNNIHLQENSVSATLHPPSSSELRPINNESKQATTKTTNSPAAIFIRDSCSST